MSPNATLAQREVCDPSSRVRITDNSQNTRRVRLEIQISDDQGLRPWWATAVEERLQQLDLLQNDWNSHGAVPPLPESMLLAVRVIAALLGAEAGRPLPQIVPTRLGGLQLEWHLPTGDVEITIDPTDAVWAYITTSEGSDDGPLTEKESAIVHILQN